MKNFAINVGIDVYIMAVIVDTVVMEKEFLVGEVVVMVKMEKMVFQEGVVEEVVVL